MVVFLNGTFVPEEEACIPARDRGFLLGEALFETLRADEGRAALLDAHLDRLFEGAALLGIPIPLPRTAFEGILSALLERNALTEAVLRITLSRGPGGRGLLPPESPEPTLLMTAHPTPPFHPALFRGIRATLLDLPYPHYGPLSRCKTTNMLPHLLGARIARGRGADEGFYLRADGLLLEGTASNLFLVDRAGVVRTPPEDLGILPGTMRRWIVSLLRALGLPVAETPVGKGDLFRAEEVFRTNALVVAEPVTLIDGAPVGKGRHELLRQLRAAYRERVAFPKGETSLGARPDAAYDGASEKVGG